MTNLKALYEAAKTAEAANREVCKTFGAGSPEHNAALAAYLNADKSFSDAVNALSSTDRNAFFASINGPAKANPFDLNRWDWAKVSCKRSVKRLAAALKGHEVDVDVARTGTVYIRVNDETIRVSDHRCYAGAWSFDGRTDKYTIPDAEIGRGATTAEIAAIVAGLGIAAK